MRPPSKQPSLSNLFVASGSSAGFQNGLTLTRTLTILPTKSQSRIVYDCQMLCRLEYGRVPGIRSFSDRL